MESIPANKKQMTISEVANTLGVSESTVLNYVKKTNPGKIKNGVKTFLNESEVTLAKLKLQQNQHLVRSSELPKTELEETLLIQQAFNLLLQKTNRLQNQIDSQKQELIVARPKIEFHDQVGNLDGLYTIGEAAKTLNLGYGRNTLFSKLRDRRIFFKTEPYQAYIDSGYFEVKTTTVNERIQKQAFVTPKGLQWLQKNQTRFSLDKD